MYKQWGVPVIDNKIKQHNIPRTAWVLFVEIDNCRVIMFSVLFFQYTCGCGMISIHASNFLQNQVLVHDWHLSSSLNRHDFPPLNLWNALLQNCWEWHSVIGVLPKLRISMHVIAACSYIYPSNLRNWYNIVLILYIKYADDDKHIYIYI